MVNKYSILVLVALIGCAYASYSVSAKWGRSTVCSGQPFQRVVTLTSSSCTPSTCQSVVPYGISLQTECITTLPTAPAAGECWMYHWSNLDCTGTKEYYIVNYNQCLGMPVGSQYVLYNSTSTTMNSYNCKDSACKDCTVEWIRNKSCLEGTTVTCAV